MVKKISIFLSNPFRKMFDENKSFRQSIGVKKAFELPQRIVHACLTQPMGNARGNAFEKIVYDNHSEFNWLSVVFEKAHRVEMELHYESIPNCPPTVSASLKFHEHGQRKVTAHDVPSLEVAFVAETGELVAVSRNHGPPRSF